MLLLFFSFTKHIFCGSSKTCGNSICKGVRPKAGKLRRMDDTGITVGSCRHGIVDKAVKINHGETFRLIHTHASRYSRKRSNIPCDDLSVLALG